MIDNIIPLPAELSIEKRLREAADYDSLVTPTRPEIQALMHEAAAELESQRRVISGLRLVEFLDLRIQELGAAQAGGYRQRIKELEEELRAARRPRQLSDGRPGHLY